MHAIAIAAAIVVACCLFRPAMAQAQTSSLYGSPDPSDPLTLEDSSWYYLELAPPREIQKHDVVTVVVQQSSQVLSEGEIERRKRAKYDAVLQNWISLEGLSLKPAEQPDGDPRIKAQIDGELRANAELETRDSMKFRIAATVVDIRPNGNLVLEAHQTIRNNEEVWEASLSGIVRREDILPDNTVLSQNVSELRIEKREQGHVRDGYRRGWLMRFLDYVKPF
jgi:flagellar L-ring protein precursor FlgH